MKKMFLMAMMALVMCGLAACSSSDDENGGQPVKKSDPALIGDWVEWTDEAKVEINQAMAFRSSGGVLMYLQRVNSGVTGGWYHAEYTVTGDGTMKLDIVRVNMRSFSSFDFCDWFAIDPVHINTEASYKISGDELRIRFADSKKDIVLKKEM